MVRITHGEGWLTWAAAIGIVLAFPSAAHSVEKGACVDAHARSQELRQSNKLRQSRAQLLICADATCPVLVRADCVDWLSQIEQRVPAVTIDARDTAGRALTAVRVIVDGETLLDKLEPPVIRVDPGEHQFRFEHVGSLPIAMKVNFREGESGRTLLVQFGAPPLVSQAPRVSAANPQQPPTAVAPVAPALASPHLRAPIASATVAVLALGTFAYFGIRGTQAASRLKDQCGSSCSPDSVAPVRTQLLVADLSLATALIAGGITAWFLLDNRRAASQKASAPVSAFVDADSIRLSYGGTF